MKIQKIYRFEKKFGSESKPERLNFLRLTYDSQRVNNQKSELVLEGPARAEYFGSFKEAREWYQKHIDFLEEVEQEFTWINGEGKI